MVTATGYCLHHDSISTGVFVAKFIDICNYFDYADVIQSVYPSITFTGVDHPLALTTHCIQYK